MAERFGMFLSNYSLDLPVQASFSDLGFSARRSSSTKYCTPSVKSSQCALKAEASGTLAEGADNLEGRI